MMEASGRRVFQQLCLKGEIPFIVFFKLEAIGELDLAFHVAISNGNWPCILQLFEHPKVSNRSRKKAFQKALKHGAWDVLTQMCRSEIMASHNVGEKVFLEAVRQNELLIAYSLLSKGIIVFDHTIVFALQGCLRLKMWEIGVDFIQKLSVWGIERNRELIIQMVQGSISDGKLKCFLKIAYKFAVTADKIFLYKLFKSALKRGEGSFVFKFCQKTQFLKPLTVAVTAAINVSEWKILKKLSKLKDMSLTGYQFALCLTKAFRRHRRPTHDIYSLLETSCQVQTAFFFSDVLDTLFFNLASCSISRSRESFFKRPYCHLDFLLSFTMEDWNFANQIVQEYGISMNKHLLRQSLLWCVNSGDENYDLTVNLLKHMQVTDFIVETFFKTCPSNAAKKLIMLCEQNGMRQWAICLAVYSHDWDLVKKEIKTCHDHCVLDFTASKAADHNQWDLVRSLLRRCSQTPSVLGAILTKAVTVGELESAKLLIRMFDASLVKHHNKSILQLAVMSNSNREEMVKVCIKAGLSTHSPKMVMFPRWNLYFTAINSPLKQALHNGQLPLVKLLHVSGASSNAELRCLKSSDALRRQLQNRGCSDMILYIEKAASSPSNLKNLCRLLISHLIGCQPGRKHRVESLEVPQLIKDFIQFSDILQD